MSYHRIFNELIKLHGPQGWWPVRSECAEEGGYHPNCYKIPQSSQGIFEVCIGAILTQNTAWSNVEKALENLIQAKALDAHVISKCVSIQLESWIRPAGYYRQKAKYLQGLSKWFIDLQGIPTREQLLCIQGVGPETADSILLYAFHIPTFVVDVYTRRIFSALRLIEYNTPYEKIRSTVMENLPINVILYQEYHALIVQHAKMYYRKGQASSNCPLMQLIA